MRSGRLPQAAPNRAPTADTRPNQYVPRPIAGRHRHEPGDQSRKPERSAPHIASVITYSAPEHILACIIERGPISVDGVSPTVIAKDNQTFSVSIVTFSGGHTNVIERAIGDPVNRESDIMMRYVAQALEKRRRLVPRDKRDENPIQIAALQARECRPHRARECARSAASGPTDTKDSPRTGYVPWSGDAEGC